MEPAVLIVILAIAAGAAYYFLVYSADTTETDIEVESETAYKTLGKVTGENVSNTGTGSCIAREGTVYTGCGFAYKNKSARDQQCPVSTTELKFIGDGISGNPCLLPRETPMYSGCGYLYTSEAAKNEQCPSRDDGILKWISDN
jgi:hypothetical protein